MKAVVAQKGCREYFIAPRALLEQDALAQLVIDWYPPFGERLSRALRRLPWRAVTRAVDGYDAGIPRRYITSFNAWALWSRWYAAREAAAGRNAAAILRTDIGFARRVSRLELPEHDVFFGFSYASLEAMQAERARGIGVVLDQLDPGIEEHHIVRREEEKHPAYVLRSVVAPEAYYTRVRQEWKLADRIVVNSEWSKACIMKHGAPSERISVLPLAWEPPPETPDGLSVEAAADKGRDIRVLWLGRVTLQKGIPYLVEAARRLQKERVHFTVIGGIDIHPDAIAAAPDNIEWLGKVTQQQVAEHYARADVFVLPTLSDGFALTQLEAMSAGLPVIATTHCGSVVEEGQSGFLIPAGSAEALAETIMRFARTPALKREMAPRCRARASTFSSEAYAEGLLAILREVASRGRN